MKPKHCPECNKEADRAIYYGLPVNVCYRHAHDGEMMGVVFGFWSWIINVLPVQPAMMVYTGSYWRALGRWMRGE